MSKSISVHNMFSPPYELGIFMYWSSNSMNNMLSYCGLVDAKIRASDKDFPVIGDFLRLADRKQHCTVIIEIQKHIGTYGRPLIKLDIYSTFCLKGIISCVLLKCIFETCQNWDLLHWLLQYHEWRIELVFNESRFLLCLDSCTSHLI